MNRVLLIHHEGNTFNNPTLKCIIDLLRKNKIIIDLRYFQNLAPMPTQSEINLLPYGRIYKKIKNAIYNQLCLNLASLVSVWFESLLIFKKYDLIIGVDREGLIEASILSKITGTPFVFFSFEIMFESETSYAYKKLEKEAAKQVKYWFVQDDLRAHHIQFENGLDQNKKVILPLASTGKGVTSYIRLRDRLGIPENKNVVLVMGSISAWSMITEILYSVSTWPDDWVLIIHERYGKTAEALNLLGEEFDNLYKFKLYYSDQASIMVDNMDEIMAGISVGLAFYRPDSNNPYTGKNLEYLGLASGKISTFLRYGVPIIMNNIGSYSDLANKYKFGIVVENPSYISGVLPRMKDQSLARAAENFFKEHLDFSNFEEEVWKKLKSAAN